MATDTYDQDSTGSLTADDWPARVSSTVVRYVGTVRDTTTGPALVASRYLVYLLAAGLIALVLVIVMMAALIRLLVVATGELSFIDSGEPWLAYYILGGIFTLAGMLFWRKKEA